MMRFLVAIFFCLTIACRGAPVECPVDLDAILSEASTDVAEPIPLAELTPFDWDTLRVFPPYHSTKEVREATGVGYRPFFGFGSIPDGRILLVFSLEERPVCSLEKHVVDSPEGGWKVGGGDWTGGKSVSNVEFVSRGRDLGGEIVASPAASAD